MLDSNGAVLTNASFTLTSSVTNPNSIVLSPLSGIQIKNKSGVSVLSADPNGNLTLAGIVYASGGSFAGNVSMLSGTIGTATQGLIVNAEGLYSLNRQNFALGDGRFHWGGLDINGSTATFSGTIYANRLRGAIVNNQIADNTITSGKIHDLNADLINAGAIKTIDFWGGKISWGGTFENPGVVQQGVDGDYRIDALNTLYFGVKADTQNPPQYAGSVLTAGRNDIYMAVFSKDDTSHASAVVQLLDKTVFINGESLYMPTLANITVYGGTSKDATIKINTPVGVQTLTFSRGILVKYE